MRTLRQLFLRLLHGAEARKQCSWLDLKDMVAGKRFVQPPPSIPGYKADVPRQKVSRLSDIR